MSKRITKDGKHYRKRRGELVEIPPEWVGNTTHPQTIRKRPSKQIHKRRKDLSAGGNDHYDRRGGGKHRKEIQAKKESDKQCNCGGFVEMTGAFVHAETCEED